MNSVRTLNDTSNSYTDKIILNKDYFSAFIIDYLVDIYLAWSPQQVCDQFLATIGLGYLGEQFVVHKIGGNVLASLNEVCEVLTLVFCVKGKVF